jgi:hypothetical protein
MTSPWTTTDCLAALRIEAEDADFAAIVVGYDRETRFVWSGRDDPAGKLESLLRQGGKPVAVLGADIVGNAFIYRLIPFPYYEDDAGTRQYLAAVGENVAEILKRRLEATLN